MRLLQHSCLPSAGETRSATHARERMFLCWVIGLQTECRCCAATNPIAEPHEVGQQAPKIISTPSDRAWQAYFRDGFFDIALALSAAQLGGIDGSFQFAVTIGPRSAASYGRATCSLASWRPR